MPDISQGEMLKLIDRALKGGIVDIDTFGDAILQPEKATRFIRKVQEAAVILPEARYIPMKSQKVDIDRISFTGRVLDSGADAGGADKELDESNYAKPTVNTNQLSANEFQAIVSIKDTALRRNIERENFEDTLIDLLGEAVGRDLEEFAIFGNTDFTYAQDHVLSKAEIVGGPGDISILGYPNNHAWGVFHKISIEREREAKKRQTDFVLTIEADMGFEDENACVVAYEDKSNPVS